MFIYKVDIIYNFKFMIIFFSQVGEVLEPNHVIVNKYSPINQTDMGESGYCPSKQEYKHTKMSYKGTAPSIVFDFRNEQHVQNPTSSSN